MFWIIRRHLKNHEKVNKRRNNASRLDNVGLTDFLKTIIKIVVK